MRTGHVARESLLACMVLLFRLGEGAPHKQEYFGAMAGALMQWTAWNDNLPSCLYVEEACEAALSRLGASCKMRPQAVTVEQGSDLYILLDPPDGARAEHAPHQPTQQLR